MSADIRSYQAAEGLSDEQMAALLTDKLGRTISVAGFKAVRSRKGAPDEWLQVLGIAPLEPTDSDIRADEPAPDAPDMNAGGEQREPRGGHPPQPLPLPFEPATAEMQITLIYQMAGRGAAYALKSPPVADVWAQAAPGIAAAYIEWARYNSRVAHYIRAITLGGPAGQLLLMHASLIATTLIVSGQVNPAQFIPPMGQETDLIGEPPPADTANEEPNGSEPSDPKPRPRRRSRSGGSPVRGVE